MGENILICIFDKGLVSRRKKKTNDYDSITRRKAINRKVDKLLEY